MDENNDTQVYTKYDNAANEWVITDRLSAATGKNFSSWSEYQGPITDKGDEFSLVERYDLSNPTFDSVSASQLMQIAFRVHANEFLRLHSMNGLRWATSQMHPFILLLIANFNLTKSLCSLTVFAHPPVHCSSR